MSIVPKHFVVMINLQNLVVIMVILVCIWFD